MEDIIKKLGELEVQSDECQKNVNNINLIINNQGKYLESLELLEEILKLQREIYSEDSPNVLF